MNKILVTRSSLPDFEEYCAEIRKLWDSRWLTNMGEEHKEFQRELDRLREEQEAFDRLMGYNIDTAYGLEEKAGDGR